AHPDPRERVPLDQRIFLHAGARRHAVLARHAHADAVAIKAEAVVAALDRVTHYTADRERRKTVRAAVGQRNSLAGAGAEEDDLLVEHGARERDMLDLARERDHLPAVSHPHAFSLRLGPL